MGRNSLDNKVITRKQKWWDWHKKNPAVYQLFKKFTFEAIEKKGAKRLGARFVIERVRWETNVETKGSGFKIDDHFIPYYARLFMFEFPEHKNLFNKRPMKKEYE